MNGDAVAVGLIPPFSVERSFLVLQDNPKHHGWIFMEFGE